MTTMTVLNIFIGVLLFLDYVYVTVGFLDKSLNLSSMLCSIIAERAKVYFLNILLLLISLFPADFTFEYRLG